MPPFRKSLRASSNSVASRPQWGIEAETAAPQSTSSVLRRPVETPYQFSHSLPTETLPDIEDDEAGSVVGEDGTSIGLLWAEWDKDTVSISIPPASQAPGVSQIAQDVLSQNRQRIIELSLPAPGSADAYNLDTLRSFPTTRGQAMDIVARRAQWAARLLLTELGRSDIRVIALPSATAWQPETHLSTAI